jgi:hypothetical protein
MILLPHQSDGVALYPLFVLLSNVFLKVSTGDIIIDA